MLLLLLLITTIAAFENINSDSRDNRRQEREVIDTFYETPERTAQPKYQAGSIGSSIKEAVLSVEVPNLTQHPSSCSQESGKPCSNEEDPCLPLIYCHAFYREVLQYNTFCKLQSNSYGARCRLPHKGRTRHLTPQAEFLPRSDLPITETVAADMNIEGVMEQAFEKLKRKQDMEKELIRMGLVVSDPKTPAYGHMQLFRRYPRAFNRSTIALIQEYATIALMDSIDASPYSISDIDSPLQCPKPSICEFTDLFYRRSDGSCNNFNNPTWGRSFATFQRLTPITYSDGISIPRKSKTGKPLPTARKVSQTTIHDADIPSQEFTLAVMQWGQFMDHDFTLTPISVIDNATGIQCCDSKGLHLPAELKHPECLPIDIPEDDPFYSQYGQRCMNFVRSLPGPGVNCRLGFRNQMDQLTHYIDGSTVYGSTQEQTNALRTFIAGKLKARNEEFPPEDNVTSRFDFLAGDNRVNEQPLLTVIHTIWLRQHNRIARQIQKQKTEWNDETVFQETRKILSAQIQHITFNEWLPIVLGTETVEDFDLLPRRKGYINNYDKNLNPNIINEFASACFRFGHTLIQGTIRLFGKNHEEIKKIELSDNFDKPQLFTKSTDNFVETPFFRILLKGLFNQPIQRFDNCIADDLTTKLLKTDASPFGMDLIALNTQRARDHGIGTYNDIREACGLPRVQSFNDLNKYLRPNATPRFESIYESVDDIDPFVAGVSELPHRGGTIGTIFNCVVREQFTRAKFGDRFFYENGGMHSSFSQAQLTEIRKTSFARIICDNSNNNVKKIQPLAFRLIDEFNVKVPCSSEAIPTPDFTSWFK